MYFSTSNLRTPGITDVLSNPVPAEHGHGAQCCESLSGQTVRTRIDLRDSRARSAARVNTPHTGYRMDIPHMKNRLRALYGYIL